MQNKTLKNALVELYDPKKEALKQQQKVRLRKDIIIGATLRQVHENQGTMGYLIQVIEPYLKKADRKLFGLPF